MWKYLLIRLDVVYQVVDSVYALLYSKMELMVCGSQLMGDLPCSQKVRSAFDADAEGVQGVRPVEGVLGLFQMPARGRKAQHNRHRLCTKGLKRAASKGAERHSTIGTGCAPKGSSAAGNAYYPNTALCQKLELTSGLHYWGQDSYDGRTVIRDAKWAL